MQQIALTMRMVQSSQGEWRDAVSQDWARYLHAQDIRPVLVPNDPEHCLSHLENVSALILTGGDDIVLKHPDDASDNPLALRDHTEVALLRGAMERRLPVLGVCRGMQFLQWYFGGKIEGENRKKGHVAKEHPVTCEGSLASLLGKQLTVNSFHGNLVRSPANGFSILARDAEGLVEGMEDAGKNLLAIMWHPERTFNDPQTAGAHASFIRNFLAQYA